MGADQDLGLCNFEGKETSFEFRGRIPTRKGLRKTSKELWDGGESWNLKKMMTRRNGRRMRKFCWDEKKNERETLGNRGED